MKKGPVKFLYIYLQDINTNPKLCFELHNGPLPEGRKSYARTVFESLEKEAALAEVRAIEDIGFYILGRLLSVRRFERGEQWAMIAYSRNTGRECSFDVDEEIYQERKDGNLYTFLPIRPFDTTPGRIDTDENSMDAVLWMRTGIILANALL